MTSYFIAYNINDGNGSGISNCQIDLEHPIRGLDDVRHVEKLLGNQLGGSVIVLYFTRFDTEASGGQRR